MSEDIHAILRRLTDRQEITDCLLRYTRGVDRLDRELAISAYHPDAIDDHGIVVLGASDFIDWAINFHKENNIAHHHIITNSTIDIDGDTAHVETYYQFLTRNPDPPGHMAFGRYLDRFERRNGEWRIAYRKCLSDAMFTVDVLELDPAYLTQFMSNGPRGRDRSDSSYQRPMIPNRLPAEPTQRHAPNGAG